jgi:hypothetical protein
LKTGNGAAAWSNDSYCSRASIRTTRFSLTVTCSPAPRLTPYLPVARKPFQLRLVTPAPTETNGLTGMSMLGDHDTVPNGWYTVTDEPNSTAVPAATLQLGVRW